MACTRKTSKASGLEKNLMNKLIKLNILKLDGIPFFAQNMFRGNNNWKI
jgi:hypothetical protein